MAQEMLTMSRGPFFAFLVLWHHIHYLHLLFLSHAHRHPHCSPSLPFWSCGCRCILCLRPCLMAPPLFHCCVLSVFAVPAVSTPQTAAHGSGVLVAVVVFASPSLVPAPLPLLSDVTLFCCCSDPSSTPQAGARSGGIIVGVLSWHLVVNNMDKT